MKHWVGVRAIAILAAFGSPVAVGSGQERVPPPQTPPAGQTAPPQTPPATPAGGRQAGPGAASPAPAPSPQAIERAAQILAETRKAMGGEKLEAVKTLLVTGRTRRVRGDNLVPIEFEIAIELPDKYVRKDEVPAEESEPTSTGFAGAEVIQHPAPPAGRGGGPVMGGPAPGGRGAGPAPGGPDPGAKPTPPGDKPATPGDKPAAPGDKPAMPPPGAKPALTPEQIAAQQRATRLNNAKQEFARLALGLFANNLEAYPLTFAFAARAEAPQGTADVLDVKGQGTFALRLFIHGETRLPIMVSWQAPPTGVVLMTPGQPAPKTVAPGAVIVQAPAAPAATAPQEEKDKYAKDVAALRQKAQSTPIEYRLYYADYRDVDGVKLPFRLRRAIGADTTEETTFDRFRLNTKIDPRKFTVPQR